MQKKTILITGATDGIGLATAKIFAEHGHSLLLHGRSADKLENVVEELSSLQNSAGAGTDIKTFIADFSDLASVKSLAAAIVKSTSVIDVLINNAGVFKTPNTIKHGLDVRFTVNTIAPYLLTKLLMPALVEESVRLSPARVINLSSAAQAPVNFEALKGKVPLADMEAYAQSKLAITMWSQYLAAQYAESSSDDDTTNKHQLTVFPVNPGSLLASNMVKEGFGVDGKDINIGANILVRLALEDGLEAHSGQYFDNDIGQFSSAHQDVVNEHKVSELVDTIEGIVAIA